MKRREFVTSMAGLGVKGIRFVEGQKLATSGGLTAGIDLALRIVERYFGREDAQFVADHLEYDSKRWIV